MANRKCKCGSSSSGSSCSCSSTVSSSSSSKCSSSSSTTACPTNLVSRTVFVDSTFGTACGEFQNPNRPFRTVRQGIKNASKHVTSTNPVTIMVRPGVHISQKPIVLVSNVFVQGSGIDETLVYAQFAAVNSCDPNACNANFATAVSDLSIVSYFNTSYFHDSDGKVSFRRLKIYQLNTLYPCNDPRKNNQLLTPECVPNPTPSKPAVTVLRGTFEINNSNIQLDLGNPSPNSDSPVFSITDKANVNVSLERTNSLVRVNNADNNGANKFISIIAYTSNNGNVMNLKSMNGLHTIQVQDSTDSGAFLLFVHATNNVSNPRVTFISNNDRLDLESPTLSTGSLTAPAQAVIKVDENVATYVNDINYFFKNNLAVPTIKYLSSDTLNKFTVIQDSPNAKTFLHHLSVVNQEMAPPTGGISLRPQVIGIEAEADNVSNGAAYTLIVTLPNANTVANTYTLRAADRVLRVDPGSPALTIILTTPQILRERTVRIYNKSSNNVTVQTQAGEIINRNNVLSTSIVLAPGDAVELFSSGNNTPYMWVCEDLNIS